MADVFFNASFLVARRKVGVKSTYTIFFIKIMAAQGAVLERKTVTLEKITLTNAVL